MKHWKTSGAPGLAVLSLGVLGCMLAGGSLRTEVQFTAVAAGDASTDDAIIWTRAVYPAVPAGTAITAQVSTDQGFRRGLRDGRRQLLDCFGEDGKCHQQRVS